MPYLKQKPETIQQMFGSIAKQYDRANAIMSFGLHWHWNKRLAEKAVASSPKTLIDLCSGTGEIALLCAKASSPPKEITLLDFSAPMLEQAKKKFSFKSYTTATFVVGDAMKLPQADHQFQAATMAYGIRNVQDAKLAIEEAHRVLEPGGTFLVLELTRPQSPWLEGFHSLYLRYLLPLLGKWAAKDAQAYQYLCDSIHTFIAPQTLALHFEEAGFTEVKIIPLTFGAAHIIEGRKR